MLKTTGITKKFEKMKKGGYTLFSDKTRKMLLAMGISLLGIGMLGQVTYAQMSAEVMFKKTTKVEEEEDKDTLGNGNVRYQITLKEDDTRFKLKGLYIKKDSEEVKLDTYVGKIEDRQETLVVIEVPQSTESVTLKNTNENDLKGYEIKLDGENVVEDNDGPEVEEGSLVMYNTSDEKYLQAKFNDATKIYRVQDQDNHNRVIIKEKDQDKVINLKYILEDDDTEFTIYDILGNPTTVSLTEETIVQVKYATRNVDGTQLALDVNDTIEIDGKTYELTGMTTGAGENIPMVEGEGNIYTGVPSGTTSIVLTYENKETGEKHQIVVPVVLGKEVPVVVAYKAEQKENENWYTVEEDDGETAKARAYINGKKAIVEVRNIQNGIAKIQLLKGNKGEYVPDDTNNNGIVYDDQVLHPTVLKVFDVTPNTTAVRVYDGVGNTADIELGISKEPDAVTIAKLTVGENGKYVLLAQDIRAGLGWIKRKGEADEDFTKEEGESEDYKQYTLDKVEIEVDANGDPIIEIYDALGNKKSVSFDEFLYRCIYATYSEHNDCMDSGSVSLNVKDERGIARIEVTMVDKDAGEEPTLLKEPTSPRLDKQPVDSDENFEENMKVWNAWKAYDNAKTAKDIWNVKYRHTYTLENFRGTSPKEVVKTYAIPDGTVEKVMVYTKYVESGDMVEEYHNTIEDLINSTSVSDGDRIKTSVDKIQKDSSNRIIGAKITAKYGIKQVKYEDGSVVAFSNELPEELYINCLIAGAEEGQVKFNGAVVTDAIGDTLTIYSDKVTFSYNDTEII